MFSSDEEDFLDTEEASILGECAKSVPTTRKKKALHRCRAWYYWWARTDLNRGPKDYEFGNFHLRGDSTAIYLDV